jgi:thioredoxin-like negative regulator of GroEL
MASVLEKLAEEMRGQAIVGLIPSSDAVLARAFEVRRIPAIFVVRNAEVVASFIGAVPRAQIEKVLKDNGG